MSVFCVFVSVFATSMLTGHHRHFRANLRMSINERDQIIYMMPTLKNGSCILDKIVYDIMI